MYKFDEEKDANTFKHIKFTNELKKKLLEFSPEEQNEIVRIFYDSVFENRIAKIDEAKKEFIHLRESLKQLECKENAGN